jgi:hypothetical protein
MFQVAGMVFKKITCDQRCFDPCIVICVFPVMVCVNRNMRLVVLLVGWVGRLVYYSY